MKNSGFMFALLGGAALLMASGAKAKGWQVPTRGQKYAKLFEKYERRFNLPKNLVAVMAGIESSYDPNAVGSVGEIGLMQIYKKYHPEQATIALTDNPTPDFTNPEQAIEYAAAYLRRLNNSIGNWSDTIRAYNWGIGNVKKWRKAGGNPSKVPEITRNYIAKVSQAVNLTNPVKW